MTFALTIMTNNAAPTPTTSVTISATPAGQCSSCTAGSFPSFGTVAVLLIAAVLIYAIGRRSQRHDDRDHTIHIRINRRH